MVIRPNSNLRLPKYDDQRVVIKKKNAEFLEKAYAPATKEKKEKKEKALDP